MKYSKIIVLLVVVSLPYLTACSLSVGQFSNDLNSAIRANNDPQTIMQAVPAYVMLLDTMIESDPEDEDTLLASSKLINAYVGLLTEDIKELSNVDNDQINRYESEKIKIQQKKLANKALERAADANCYYEDKFCNLITMQYSVFEEHLKDIDKDDLDMLYSLGSAWASWLQINSDDWNAMAKLPQIKLIMQKVISIDERWDNAGAHIYLGVLNSIIPSSLGGKPEVGRASFEKAIALTQGKNLMAKVLYAEYYARLIYDRELHQKLILEVLNYNKSEHEYILINTLAIRKAKILQANSEEYF